MSALEQIYQWQVAAGNASRPYDDFLESSFQVEEALEGFNLGDYYSNPKEASRAIVEPFTFEGTDVDRLDKALDAIIFAVGSIAKLGLTPEQLERALLAVNSANQQKLSMPRDEHGKLTKPADFVGPEPELQKILDERP
jgi:hypothetical protein